MTESMGVWWALAASLAWGNLHMLSARLLCNPWALLVVAPDMLTAVYIRLAVLTGVLTGHGTMIVASARIAGQPACRCVSIWSCWGCYHRTLLYRTPPFLPATVRLGAPAVQQLSFIVCVRTHPALQAAVDLSLRHLVDMAHPWCVRTLLLVTPWLCNTQQCAAQAVCIIHPIVHHDIPCQHAAPGSMVVQQVVQQCSTMAGHVRVLIQSASVQ